MDIISHITQLLAPIISHHPTSSSLTHMDTNYTNTSPHRKPHSNNQSNGSIIPNTCTYHQGRRQKFLFEGPSCSTDIFIKTTPHIHIYTHLFIIYTLFYLISYIYTHTQKKKKKVQYFQSKLCLMAIFHKIKFIFFLFSQ